MSDRANIILSEEDHIYPIAKCMRDSDRREVWDTYHLSPERALRLSFLTARTCMTAIDDKGCPVCMFGVSAQSAVSLKGEPWLLGTDGLMNYQIQLISETRKRIKEWLKDFCLLQNYVANYNETSKRWLKWAGFTLDSPEPFGPDGVLFCKFYKWREYV